MNYTCKKRVYCYNKKELCVYKSQKRGYYLNTKKKYMVRKKYLVYTYISEKRFA